MAESGIQVTSGNSSESKGYTSSPHIRQQVNFKGMDLPSPWGESAANGMAGAVSIPDNLPILGIDTWHECLDYQPAEYSSGQEHADSTPQSGTEREKEEDRWNFVMNKLISIENNTSGLTRDVHALNTKVDNQAELLKEVKSSTGANKQKINELYKKQENLMEEVDQRVAAQLKIFEASMQRGNMAFQAQVRSETDGKI